MASTKKAFLTIKNRYMKTLYTIIALGMVWALAMCLLHFFVYTSIV